MDEAPAPALRPLGIGEILDVAIKITLRNWKVLFGLVALIVAPLQVVVAGVNASALAIDDTGTIDDEDVGVFVGGVVVIVVLGVLSTLLSQAVAFRAVMAAYLGGRPDWRESLSFVLRRLHAILWLSFVALVFLVFAMIPCFVPAIWLGVAWVVAMPALLTEDVRGVKALRRSFRLVRGRWWPSFGLLVLGFVLVTIFATIVQLLFTGIFFVAESTFALFLVDAIGGTIGSVITTPILAAFISVLYVDLRVRKEGFDLELLAERFGEPAVGTTS